MARMEEQDYDEKRLARRQRRRRSQIIAYIILITFMLFMAALIVFGVYFIRKALISRPQVTEVVTDVASVEDTTASVIETPTAPEAPVYTEDQLLDEIIETVISEMPVEDKVAGLYIVTPEQLTGVETAVKAGSGTQEALTAYAVGGIAYSSKNIKTTDQIKEMLLTTTSMSKYPIFTILSQQANLSEAVVTTLGIGSDAEIKDAESAEGAGESAGAQLYRYGFNFDMAPDMEITVDEEGGKNTDKVRETTAAFAKGLGESGIISCAYMFPVSGDTASEPVSNNITKDELVLGPYEVYKNSIDTGTVAAIMLSNVSLPQIVGDETPASLSATLIKEELRGTLGFDGIVITAPLSEGAITQRYTASESAVQAIKAGADMIYDPEDFKTSYEALLNAVKDGTVPEERINESLRRIYKVKYADKANQISS